MVPGSIPGGRIVESPQNLSFARIAGCSHGHALPPLPIKNGLQQLFKCLHAWLAAKCFHSCPERSPPRATKPSMQQNAWQKNVYFSRCVLFEQKWNLIQPTLVLEIFFARARSLCKFSEPPALIRVLRRLKSKLLWTRKKYLKILHAYFEVLWEGQDMICKFLF